MLRIAAASPTAPQWKPEEYRLAFASERSHKTGQVALFRMVLIAETEGVVCGFAVVAVLATLYPADAELESLAVDVSWRRRGAGAALVKEAKHLAKQYGADALRLEVRAGNRTAIGLYERSGFAPLGVRPGYYANPTEDAICMEVTNL